MTEAQERLLLEIAFAVNILLGEIPHGMGDVQSERLMDAYRTVRKERHQSAHPSPAGGKEEGA